jgi:hypothetical protein
MLAAAFNDGGAERVTGRTNATICRKTPCWWRAPGWCLT